MRHQGQHRYRHARSARTLVAALIVFATSLQPASAQQRRNLLDMLFGGPRYEDERPSRELDRYPRYERPRVSPENSPGGSIVDMPSRPPRNHGSVRALAPRAVPAPTPPQPEPVAKLENARKVLVIGDFLAGGMGGELETAFEAAPGVTVSERSDGSSGLVRDDHFDWIAELPKILDEEKPAIVVVMLGANDRQQIATATTKEKFRSDGWLDEYDARIAKLIAVVTARKLPLLWVGLPSFQSPSMMADAATLNGLYRNEVEKAGAEFVDVWDGFVDEEGKYVVSGSDMNGQQVRLRGADGITFTKTGKRKLAFYVERFVRRHLGEMTSPDLAPGLVNVHPGEKLVPAEPGQPLTVQPVSLSDPDLDGGKELLGASILTAPNAANAAETPREKLVRRGELATAPAGRVDDYRLKAGQ
ncbi:MAG: GDSL-type esterase/lipase family protein [Neorhizobium sp.]|nr:GDSL-type esterase/lipase family protein [Neorhizobium sp.]